MHPDLFANDGDREAAAFRLAEDGENDLGGRFAAHALDRLVHAQALDEGFVNLGDQVAAFQAGAKGGRAFNGRDHLDQAVFHADFDAHTDEFAGGAFAELLEGGFVEIL